MKNGKCPKCNSSQVFKQDDGLGYLIPHGLGILGKFYSIWHYACTDCGYVESYVRNSKDIEDIKKDWEKV